MKNKLYEHDITAIAWQDKHELLERILQQAGTIAITPLMQGMEAEAVKVATDADRYVLKIWSRDSKPDIRLQYQVMNMLHERGISVSKPIGWGINASGHSVLLTTFDGDPLRDGNAHTMREIANLLDHIHRISPEEIDRHTRLPRYNFRDYFFPGMHEYPDLYPLLEQLVELASPTHKRIIHGDFHLGNIVEQQGRLTVIDWTNVQLGDPRYDFAWSLTLQQFYIPEHFAEVFRDTYVAMNEIQREELEVFQALACLRWMLLYRNGGVPMGADTLERVRRLLTSNPHLHGVTI
ncbi:aminoglycoside phosphotransferase family protein [Paenibacillus alvei]|uniref:Aminoglycoside phosphotransferase family protein n=2 Tax=Paenibacillus alvei TaxID=44250 RepID=A0ABT4H4R6_PAEAL|nr:aminoglycoside phosphotransferase family protein [Paenibacillus alvei]EJW19326.1 aminoglycoside phosphotransferase [Paenibacillus alvei DSM 29]MCY9539378.1 aminoglycoside phosphotransferase family protein [Paenibacillus alvei]MCY9735919.1 aminoglycoside phosphotransferase family protein [Paenibacillus alvei]MCY9756716.1 aminoglycoside phosphotransferase family protein [Paenibacillus alvei]MCY9763939.1 aminoglycoside phosphotransferase family protein [Paenibacillus alvei]